MPDPVGRMNAPELDRSAAGNRQVHRWEMCWRAPFARGCLSVQSITGVAPFLGAANQMPTIRAVGSRGVPVFAYGDLSAFLARLNVINSAIPGGVRGFAGLCHQVTGRVATRREGRRTDAE